MRLAMRSLPAAVICQRDPRQQFRSKNSGPNRLQCSQSSFSVYLVSREVAGAIGEKPWPPGAFVSRYRLEISAGHGISRSVSPIGNRPGMDCYLPDDDRIRVGRIPRIHLSAIPTASSPRARNIRARVTWQRSFFTGRLWRSSAGRGHVSRLILRDRKIEPSDVYCETSFAFLPLEIVTELEIFPPWFSSPPHPSTLDLWLQWFLDRYTLHTAVCFPRGTREGRDMCERTHPPWIKHGGGSSDGWRAQTRYANSFANSARVPRTKRRGWSLGLWGNFNF